MTIDQTRGEMSPAEKLLEEIEQFILDKKYFYLRGQPLIGESLEILRIRAEDELKKEQARKKASNSSGKQVQPFINKTDILETKGGRYNRWG